MSDDQTIATYNAQAQRYADLVSRTEPDADLQRFMDGVPAGGTVLDLGCGPGNSAAMMQKAGLAVTATDASEEMIRIARDTFGLDAKVAVFDDLDAVEAYDGIWANFSLLHAPRDDLPRHLAAIHTALRPGGLFHIGMKTGEGMQRDRLGRRYAYFTPTELRALLGQAGFAVETEREGEDKALSGEMSPFVVLTARKTAA
ncbi:class I SAM-dependent DNA methyltransferase [Pontivivens insulae]|uniref:Trans-aconitate 2-methyltransferase n=1 Tax=Pontivivens insulae TaxID=1639689 RepID=A0A2R8A8P4_9RHOB|nr:class I SAM-dependent methyltransferase [Pontivivens insulae]RED18617.1 methyltransferase family protein [Pontivivens insulae]SPF28515.1 Trans-aconitate 2-methyltransferase [Pontivivens insulae]